MHGILSFLIYSLPRADAQIDIRTPSLLLALPCHCMEVRNNFVCRMILLTGAPEREGFQTADDI